MESIPVDPAAVPAPDPCPLFPLSCRYDQDWIRENSLGEGVLYNLESLCQVMEIKPGMRVLDLGCGKAISAIFLAREYGAQVWALDKMVAASDNFRRVQQLGCENKVFPLQLNARELPFPHEFFDAVLVVDSYHYFGTDEKFTPYICRYLKPGGLLGVVDICFTRPVENQGEAPAYLHPQYASSWYFIHTVDWWRNFWNKTGLLEVTTAELCPQNEFIRQRYIADTLGAGQPDAFASALQHDEDGLIAFFRLVARRTNKQNVPDTFD